LAAPAAAGESAVVAAPRAKPRRTRTAAKPARPARQPSLAAVPANGRARKPRKARPVAGAR